MVFEIFANVLSVDRENNVFCSEIVDNGNLVYYNILITMYIIKKDRFMKELINYNRTRLACYCAYFTMSSVFCLPPLLFVTFHEKFGISWTLLGTLVVANFCTQLIVDLLFSALSKRMRTDNILKVAPLITSAGLLMYALLPTLFPDYAYFGLLAGTVVFSVAAGLSEVLLSPTIAAIPSDDPQRDMSLLHSLYAFGIFTVALVGSLFIRFAGADNWMYLTLFFATLPIIASVMFMRAPMPKLSSGEGVVTVEGTKKRTLGIALCIGCIFLGSCAENAMSNWISSYMEAQLHIDKTFGDIFGMAAFAVLLGICRVCYAKWGKSITKVLLISMVGACMCYLTVGFSSNTVVSFIACTLTGIFTSMLWPGTLIMMEEKIPSAGVAAYALMAAGGDLGASVAPQLLGVIADSHDLQAGMLVCSIFPFIGMFLILALMRIFRADRKK